ncbi:MAG: selenide, water dikinase SelD [Oceanospirillaceae bacterium]|uniref:selenide, water dikinase SelD n=1 Tax=unclassified Thalassolituus TaxID=2624967 RepID=UPI000C0A6114|nr:MULTISPECIES: selenide, water dikinase SelD [unclassified Thalassolituus]MAK91587.1 selenide, water dikinase SelD [Thalassolituus sp.]MAS25831.1 selenide, water dikinase SelD [Oceanospirillaceae bacterium]MAY00123.1 selenide, water dikinase SelD [Oceanospirillaceae bacterium]MBL35728.1 selenide, water dikinase SelD [Oceanospirillaceae bacterium]MBS51510.1 selenide, water dikinase SelD [Oceanospirillaceae bacterium]
MSQPTSPVRLTEYSHGAGCGCKISPKVLDTILASSLQIPADASLLVGNSSKDDAAAYDLGNGQVILSTTDFFMPIADDPFDFGRIAATNAISDIYAMGGKPLMAIAILGWPVNVLPPEVAQQVVDGGRQACADAGILLAGGHSIDSPEPIFGLAVTGLVAKDKLKQNNTATAGCKLYLTKPLGVGILTTAQKQKKLRAEDEFLARDVMCIMNKVGAEVSQLEGVEAITDVTGFGLMGHLLEVCEGSGVNALIYEDAVPLLPPVKDYIAMGCLPGGTTRNFESYGEKLAPLTAEQKALFCDPQTSGGLLIAVQPDKAAALEVILTNAGVHAQSIGELVDEKAGFRVEVINGGQA